MAKAFRRTVERIPDNNFLGTRDEKQEGKPYVWKSWKTCDKISDSLSKGAIKLGLVPEIIGENDKRYKFMGVYSKNREEWILTAIANFKNSVTTVAFYDTLGPQAVEFVIRQTELTSISCAGQYVNGLIKLKKEGKAGNV